MNATASKPLQRLTVIYNIIYNIYIYIYIRLLKEHYVGSSQPIKNQTSECFDRFSQTADNASGRDSRSAFCASEIVGDRESGRENGADGIGKNN